MGVFQTDQFCGCIAVDAVCVRMGSAGQFVQTGVSLLEEPVFPLVSGFLGYPELGAKVFEGLLGKQHLFDEFLFFFHRIGFLPWHFYHLFGVILPQWLTDALNLLLTDALSLSTYRCAEPGQN